MRKSPLLSRVSASFWHNVQLIDLDVAGKAFQILSCLNIALIDSTALLAMRA